MAPVTWTPQAADDLEAIAQFIAKDSPDFASLFVTDVLDAVDRVAESPEFGRMVPEIGERTIRKIILGSYRIIYRLRTPAVEILTVYHGARLLPPSSSNRPVFLLPALA
ncbi:MAG: type II toxin-antitoxin system RelE/ParE family toxin [Planctomycetes bacterium]|jgi:plasmid stabilization system protein ParE|nr:type II toxin-antitoxin system RelE/ParE family toxin [Planctomycetota bacterium]